jgi:intein/homing endonuclease
MYEGIKEKNVLKGIQLSFNTNEKKYINDVIQIVQKCYNKETKVKIIGNTAILRIFGKIIAQDMEKYAQSLSGNKYWSEFIFHMNRDCCKHLLCGLIRGDGGYYENRATYCTKSKQLAHQVFRMFLRFGILPSFNLNNNIYNSKQFQRYIFGFSSSETYSGFINIYELYNTPIKKSKRIIKPSPNPITTGCRRGFLTVLFAGFR